MILSPKKLKKIDKKMQAIVNAKHKDLEVPIKLRCHPDYINKFLVGMPLIVVELDFVENTISLAYKQ